ncbi:MAG: hypothetical protein ACREIV_09955 [Planctomycetaceae bacterium]
MSPHEMRDTLRQQPFSPFRLIMTDGIGYDIRHPDLLMIGVSSAMVGLTARPDEPYYERTVKIDLAHIVHLEPLERTQAS